MSRKPTADQVNTLGNGRLFLQFCGPSAVNSLSFGGYETQYLALEGVSRPIRGGITPIRVPSGATPKKTQVVGYSNDAPDFPTGTLRATERHGGIPFQWGPLDQPMNLYVVRGNCERLDDFDGWTDFLEVYSYARATDGDMGSRTPVWDNDDMVDDGLSLTFFNVYAMGAISFGYKGLNETNAEVIDVTYANTRGCGDCGVYNPNGTSRWYAVTRNGASSPGLLPEVIYTTDGVTILQKNIENFGAAELPLAIKVVGNYLVVLGSGAYYYAPISKRSGLLGTFTKVTSGFDAAHPPTDMFVASPREVYFSAEDGWIYKSTALLQGVSVLEQGNVTSEHLARIVAFDDIILATGNSGTIIFSENRGQSFTSAPVSPTGYTFTAAEILNGGEWLVGSGAGDGKLFHTNNFGNSWTQITLPESNAIHDIKAPTLESIFVAYSTSTPSARIASSQNGGNSWVFSSDSIQPRLVNMPTFARPNRLAFPDVEDSTIAANNLLIGGLATGATDGVIVLGAAPFV